MNATEKPLRVCVLQPDYSTSDVDYQYYDPPRNLQPLLPDAVVDHVFLNKLTTYKQLRELKKKNYDIYVNLCEGYLDWTIPSVDVIYCMELLGLPFTGPSALLYDPSKELMKYVAYTCGVKTPAFVLLQTLEDCKTAAAQLQFPLFVKPAKAGDSLGVDHASKVHTYDELYAKAGSIMEEYGPLLAEEYIDGREITALVFASQEENGRPTVLKPIEYIFPEGFAFKTYSLKTSELHPGANVPVHDPEIIKKVAAATENIFAGFDGIGYARLDFRMDGKGDLYFLEINFTCSVFYTDGYEGSADHILREDGIGQAGFLRKIITEGIARHRRTHKPYRLKGNVKTGYGIFATRAIAHHEVIFHGEESAQRLTTRRHVETHWQPDMQEVFRRYAYPISKEVFILWDTDPNGWAPQNHSCSPNTRYDGLNVVATEDIAAGDELTLDYASFLDEHMEPFTCHCGAPNCRGRISGIPGNSITSIESALR